MTGWHLEPRKRRYNAEAVAITSGERRQNKRELFLEHLARNHASPFGVKMDIARRHVDAVSVTARKKIEVIEDDDGI
jgi:hypothetical protein